VIAVRIVAFALANIAGIVLATVLRAPVPPPLLIAFCLAGAGLSAWLFLRERRWQASAPWAVVLAATLAALPLGYARTVQAVGPPHPDSLRHLLRSLPDASAVGLRGTIRAEPRRRGPTRGELIVMVDHVRLATGGPWRAVRPGRVQVRTYLVAGSSASIRSVFARLMDMDAYGYRIQLDATYHRIAPVENPGTFDLRRYLHQQNILTRFRCYAGRITVQRETRGHFLMELALSVKQNFLDTFRRTIRSPASRLAAAATLGARNAVHRQFFRGHDIRRMFQHAGVGHVLAVSGLHVSIVSLLLYALFRGAGLRPRAFTPLLIGLLVVFTLLTGCRPSSVRATVMNAVVLTVLAYFRLTVRQATGIGLALSSLVILLINPLILPAPSFLLSFGAVLSLVLIAPPLDRGLQRLRGAALLFALGWFAFAVLLCCIRGLNPFLRTHTVLALFGALWLLILAGDAVNHRFPQLWMWGLERLPTSVRLLISAQLAIQVGMMIPMSAWFFGRFPVAGIFVNLLAIPAIGLLVQLSVLTGIAGALPFAGAVLARPFGAAATLVAHGFLELAAAGAAVFPYPPAPKPSPAWMVGYYGFVALLLAAEARRGAFQDALYRWRPRRLPRPAAALTPYALPALLVLAPLLHLATPPDRCRAVTCLSGGRFPVVLLVSERNRAIAINAGGAYPGGRVLFEAARHAGAVELDTLLLCSPDPSAGLPAAAELLAMMPVHTLYVPAAAATPDAYLQALGDRYLAARAAEGVPWAVRYVDAYRQLTQALENTGTRTRRIESGPVPAWENMDLEILPLPAELPARFVTSARTPLVQMRIGHFTALVLTDSRRDVVKQFPAFAEPCDLLIAADLSSRPFYRQMLSILLDRARPRLLVLAATPDADDFDASQWVEQYPGMTVLSVEREGALTVLPDDGNGLWSVAAYKTGRRWQFPRGTAAPPAQGNLPDAGTASP